MIQKEYKTWYNWVKISTIYERDKNLIKVTNGICINQNLSLENETHKIFWNFEI